MNELRKFFGNNTTLIATILIGIFAFLAFRNNYQHVFHLDSTYGLERNVYVRSLSHIPQYFIDPMTLTSYRPNVDYRPVLQVTYAVNYAISGYKMWSWHLMQILLHIVVAVFLFLFMRRLLPYDHHTERKAATIAFLGVCLFVIHPYTSGVINYLWARSSLLVAALLVPSFYFSLIAIESKNDQKKLSLPYCLSVLAFTLALFAKVEAIAALAVYPLLGVIVTVSNNANIKFSSVLRSLFSREAIRFMLPFILVGLSYFIIRFSIVPEYSVDMRAGEHVTRYRYLITQFTSWWYYIFTWFAPVRLVADYASYPLFQSVFEPRVLLALAGWGGVALWGLRNWRRRPASVGLAICALALISPHSSVAPLAEMVNEHRPYLPLALASFIWISPFVGWSFSLLIKRPRLKPLWILVVVTLHMALMGLTLERNEVFASSRSYWGDIVKKAPSARSHLNYALSFMREAKYKTAERHIGEALRRSPKWFIVHINMGIVQDAMGNTERGLEYLATAIGLEKESRLARFHRAKIFYKQKRYDEAKVDLDLVMEYEPSNCSAARLRQRIHKLAEWGGDAPELPLVCR